MDLAGADLEVDAGESLNARIRLADALEAQQRGVTPRRPCSQP
jgi:hypothetical protein